MPGVCIIPARAGSSRLPGKNKRPFLGRPIIEYSIEAAKQSGSFDQIVVSTDDDDIRDIAWKNGATYLEREPEFARNEIGTKALIAREIERLGVPAGKAVCCIYPCAPMITSGALKQMLWILWARACNFIVTVTDQPLADAGHAYIGCAAAWTTPDIPIISMHTTLYPIRAVDINTLDDWQRAERLYAELRQEVA